MERIPEPDLMNDAEQAEAYAAADFSDPHDAFVAFFKSRFSFFSRGNVLDLGCGTADVIIRFSEAYPEAAITGLDGSQAMLDIGLREVALKGLTQRISIEKQVLPDMDVEGRTFDAVISNSLLHHLKNPMDLWSTVNACAKRGAPIFVMDLMRPESVENAHTLVQTYAANESPILQKDFYNSLLAAYNTGEIKSQLRSSGLEYLLIEKVSDRHILVWGTKS
jgi:ubiquinone/menaquinone biosynthesis C-methylase UbiE